MNPTINDGQLIIIRTDCKSVKNGRVYVFNQDDGQRVKRLYRYGKALVIISDNPDLCYPPELVQGDEIGTVSIVGEVIWASGSI